MPKATITLRIEDDKRQALVQLAVALDRVRSYVLNQAIDAYLDVHAWQIEHIKEGLKQAVSSRPHR